MFLASYGAGVPCRGEATRPTLRSCRSGGSHHWHLWWSPARAAAVTLAGMEPVAMSAPAATLVRVAPAAATPAPTAVADCPVAATMRRVHEQLRRGMAPSYDALLAYGEPAVR